MSYSVAGSRIVTKREKARIISAAVLVILVTAAAMVWFYTSMTAHYTAPNNYAVVADYPQITAVSTGNTLEDSKGRVHLLVSTTDGQQMSLLLTDDEVPAEGAELKVHQVAFGLASDVVKARSLKTPGVDYYLWSEPLPGGIINAWNAIPLAGGFIVLLFLTGVLGVCYSVILLVARDSYSAPLMEAWYGKYYNPWPRSAPTALNFWCALSTGAWIFYEISTVLAWATPPDGSINMLAGFGTLLLGLLFGFLIIIGTHSAYVKFCVRVYARASAGGISKVPAQILLNTQPLPPWLQRSFNRSPKDEETISTIMETFEGSLKELCQASIILGPEKK